MEKENISQCIHTVMPQQIVETLVHRNGSEYKKIYVKERFLGKGGYAKCFLTRNKESNKKVATKVIVKSHLNSVKLRQQLARQIKLQKYLRHPNVVELYSNFEDQSHFYINLQVCENGSLVDLLRTRFTLSTPEVQSILLGLCSGVRYLHSKQIIHRDLKIANLFLDAKNVVKIGDFGLATRLQVCKERKRTACGTPNYIAPQILSGTGYSYEVDIWSIGIVIYSLFCCVGPFGEEQTEQLMYANIKKCSYTFPNYHRIPPQGIDLIKRILVPSPCDRLSIEQIMDHAFMKMGSQIPVGLPNIIFKRAPTKKQWKQWYDQTQTKYELQQSSITQNSLIKCSSLKALNNISKRQKPPYNFDYNDTCFAIICEKMQQNIIFFVLNNGNYGVIDMQKGKMYVRNMKQHDDSKKVKKVMMEQNSCKFNLQQIEQIEIEKCEHRVLLGIKQKQLKLKQCSPIGSQLQLSMANYHICKLIKSKKHQLFILKMEHPEKNVLQIVFQQQGDGFIFEDLRHTLYFASFLPTSIEKQNAKPNYVYHQINIDFQTGDLRHSENKKNKQSYQYCGLSFRKLRYATNILKQAIWKDKTKQ